MRSTFRLYFLLFVAFMTAVSAGYAAAAAEDAPREAEGFAAKFLSFEPYHPPKPLPALELHAFDGSRASLEKLEGAWRLVNFWTTWCLGCVREIPLLRELEEARRDKGFDVVFISLDDVDSADALKQKMQRFKVPANFDTYYVTDPAVWDKTNISALPTSFIVDPEGRIRFKLVGDTDWTAKESLEFIDELMNNQASGSSP